jgi:hypothetical protein
MERTLAAELPISKPDSTRLREDAKVYDADGLIYLSHLYAEYFVDGGLELWSTLSHDVEIESVWLRCDAEPDCKDRELFKGPIRLSPGGDGVFPRKLALQIDPVLLNSKRHIEIRSSLAGQYDIYNIKLARPRPLSNPLLLGRSTIDELSGREYITLQGQEIRVVEGDWSIRAPIIVPRGYTLVIDAGASLRFDPESYILSHGRVSAEGTKDRPILLTASNARQRWLGIYVVRAPEESFFNYVNITSTRAFAVGALNLTGAVTFYESNVTIANSKFVNTVAEDALNIVRSDFRVDSTDFEDARSDAVDLDFSDGKVSQLFFRDIAGDGLDTSGSVVQGENLFFRNIVDKAVSAGEGSDVHLIHVDVERVGSAVVSKDGSRLRVDGLEWNEVTLFVAMSYVKKPAYGPAVLELFDAQVPEDSLIRQTGSDLSLEGMSVVEQRVDVDSLYSAGPMRKIR